MLVAALVALAALAADAGEASAHRLSFSKGRWTIDPAAATVEARLFLDVLSLRPAFDLIPPPAPEARPTWRASQRDEILAAIASGIAVTSEGRPCPVEGVGLDAQRREDVLIPELRWRCRPGGEHAVVTLTFLARLPSDHRHLARLTWGSHVTLRSFDAERPSWVSRFEAAAAPTGSAPAAELEDSGFGALVLEGVRHIGLGFDHLVFLLALLVPGGRLRSLATIVTAFTLGHSLTLALAAFDVVQLDERLIEVAIAGSVVLVGLENLWTRRVAARWAVAGLFGLVHGFGFAGALRELGLTRGEIVEPLLGFNLGVELGQLAVVLALAWPLTHFAARPWYRRRVVIPVSLAVSAAGLIWLVERLA